MPDIGTFTYRFRGFERPPTTHYMRPYYLAQQKLVQHNKDKKLCHGASPRHAVHYNHVRQMFRQLIKNPIFDFEKHSLIRTILDQPAFLLVILSYLNFNSRLQAYWVVFFDCWL